MLWRIEFRKHLTVFSCCYAVIVVTGIAALVLPDVIVLEAVQAFGTMLAWSAAVVYSAVVLFWYFGLGRDILLHIGTVSRVYVLLMKASVLGILLYVLFGVTFAFQAHAISNATGTQFPAVVAYICAGKALSILAFLVLSLALCVIVKMLGKKVPMIVVYTVLMVGVVLAQVILLWRVGAPNASQFFVGVGGDFFTANLYANILPITLTGPGDGFLPSVTGVSMLLNSAAAVVYLVLWVVATRGRRMNFVAV